MSGSDPGGAEEVCERLQDAAGGGQEERPGAAQHEQ